MTDNDPRAEPALADGIDLFVELCARVDGLAGRVDALEQIVLSLDRQDRTRRRER
jgi:hypothetical protein